MYVVLKIEVGMCFDLFKGIFQDMVGSFKALNRETTGRVSRLFYKKKFFNHLSSFESFKDFIRYPDIKEKNELCLAPNAEKKDNVCVNNKNEKIACFFPCIYNFQYKKLYQCISTNELYEIYKDIKNNYQYDNTKQVRFGTFNNRPRGITVTGESQYVRNCSAIYNIILRKTKEIYNKKLQIEFEKQKREEQIKEEKERQHRYKGSLHIIKIIDVFQSHNPYQNNAKSIGIKYLIKETKETLLDFLTDNPNKEINEYKIARFFYALDLSIDLDIFNKDYDKIKKEILGKELFAHITEDHKKLDIMIGSIFYNINTKFE